MAALIFLLFPAVVMAGIEIELSGKFDGENSNMGVYFSGNEVGVISDLERSTFGLNDNALKDAVRSYFGKRPSDAYLRSPTPWGDLYQTYGWSQVVRTLVPKSGRILKITSEPQIVMHQVFENNSTKEATFNVGISQNVENKMLSSWSKGGDLSIGQEIKYEVDMEVMNVGGKTSLSYTSSWGEDTERSQTVTVGATSGIDLMLQPGQSVLAELHVTKGSLRVEVEYEASLSGAVAVNYEETYRGHYFWALDVQGVMAASNMSNRLPSKQIIDIGFYANAKVLVRDRSRNTKIMEVSV